jgi:hypothetical protein
MNKRMLLLITGISLGVLILAATLYLNGPTLLQTRPMAPTVGAGEGGISQGAGEEMPEESRAARHEVEPVGWFMAREAIAFHRDVSFAAQYAALSPEYTAIVYTIVASPDGELWGWELTPTQVTLTGDQSRPYEPLRIIPLGAVDGVSLGVIMFPPRQEGVELLRLSIPVMEMRHAADGLSRQIEGRWELLLLENRYPQFDRLRSVYQLTGLDTNQYGIRITTVGGYSPYVLNEEEIAAIPGLSDEEEEAEIVPLPGAPSGPGSFSTPTPIVPFYEVGATLRIQGAGDSPHDEYVWIAIRENAQVEMIR